MGTKRHANFKWDLFQVIIGDTLDVLRPMLVKLTFIAILDLLCMIAWDVGFIPPNVHAKVECDENVAIMIQGVRPCM
jgi:hypothetical protein